VRHDQRVPPIQYLVEGGRTVLCDPHRAIVAGPSRLKGALMTSPDIRAGMAMLLAAVCAEGRLHHQQCRPDRTRL
jgi:UDP-N-acetylglucosamine enolpyruvyl transferase